MGWSSWKMWSRLWWSASISPYRGSSRCGWPWDSGRSAGFVAKKGYSYPFAAYCLSDPCLLGPGQESSQGSKILFWSLSTSERDSKSDSVHMLDWSIQDSPSWRPYFGISCNEGAQDCSGHPIYRDIFDFGSTRRQDNQVGQPWNHRKLLAQQAYWALASCQKGFGRFPKRWSATDQDEPDRKGGPRKLKGVEIALRRRALLSGLWLKWSFVAAACRDRGVPN